MRLPDELQEEIASATSVQDAMPVLEELLGGGYNVLPNGDLYFIKELVGRVNGLSIYVYAKDHPPPHFHLRGGGIDAAFSIRGCELLKGQISPRHHDLIRWWHRESKNLLAEAWARNQIQ